MGRKKRKTKKNEWGGKKERQKRMSGEENKKGKKEWVGRKKRKAKKYELGRKKKGKKERKNKRKLGKYLWINWWKKKEKSIHSFYGVTVQRVRHNATETPSVYLSSRVNYYWLIYMLFFNVVWFLNIVFINWNTDTDTDTQRHTQADILRANIAIFFKG